MIESKFKKSKFTYLTTLLLMILDRSVIKFIGLFKLVLLASLSFGSFSFGSVTKLKVDPFCLRKIGGFLGNIFNPGLGFDTRVKKDELCW